MRLPSSMTGATNQITSLFMLETPFSSLFLLFSRSGNSVLSYFLEYVQNAGLAYVTITTFKIAFSTFTLTLLQFIHDEWQTSGKVKNLSLLSELKKRGRYYGWQSAETEERRSKFWFWLFRPGWVNLGPPLPLWMLASSSVKQRPSNFKFQWYC